jgi:hypothetical protein
MTAADRTAVVVEHVDTAVEVAYRIPGRPWRRRRFATETDFDYWLDRLDDDVEVITAA